MVVQVVVVKEILKEDPVKVALRVLKVNAPTPLVSLLCLSQKVVTA